MIKVLFVCLGNICRSPMAEFIFRDMVTKRGLADQFHIASAATSREEIGNPVYPPVRKLLGALGIELYHMVTIGSEYFADVTHMLHNLLSIVVGLEFVRMLIDTTPANILEVLTVAITRHVVLSHDDPWSNLACIACIAGLFAIRRFLIRRSELKQEMVENE